MPAELIWYFAATAAIVVELMTGTFYLLILALALGLGGACIQTGQGGTVAMLVSAGVAVLGWGLLWLTKKTASDTAEPDSNALDIGQTVELLKPTKEQGSPWAYRVRYRGTEWDALLQEPHRSDATHAVIVGQDGNTLLLKYPPAV